MNMCITCVDDDKDILAGLPGLNKASVLLVGGLFGSLGYLINIGLEPLLGEYADTIASTVIISAVIARIFWKHRIISKYS